MLRGENLDFRALNSLGMLNTVVQILSFFLLLLFHVVSKHRIGKYGPVLPDVCDLNN